MLVVCSGVKFCWNSFSVSKVVLGMHFFALHFVKLTCHIYDTNTHFSARHIENLEITSLRLVDAFAS